MVEKSQQEIVTLTGKLKMGVMNKTSINGDKYYSVPMELDKENSIQAESIMLIFWEKNFDNKTQDTISKLSEGQTITVHGHVGGRDNGLMKVIGLETDSEVFI